MQETIEILYEDAYIIAFNKPNNILVHHSHYARNIKDDSLVERVENQLNQRLYPIHRLDRKTSGVILFSKGTTYISKFQDLFLENKIQKKYYAIVRGKAPAEGQITSPVKHPETKKRKEAHTDFKCIKSIELNIPVHPYETSRYSLLELIPKTGRIHQLRIHLNKISHPIVGDYKYGDRFHNRMFENEFDSPFLFLHAHNLQFTHPFTEKHIEIRAQISKNWNNILKGFNWDLSTI